MHSTRAHEECASEAVHQGSQTIAISPCLVIDMYTFHMAVCQGMANIAIGWAWRASLK